MSEIYNPNTGFDPWEFEGDLSEQPHGSPDFSLEDFTTNWESSYIDFDSYDPDLYDPNWFMGSDIVAGEDWGYNPGYNIDALNGQEPGSDASIDAAINDFYDDIEAYGPGDPNYDALFGILTDDSNPLDRIIDGWDKERERRWAKEDAKANQSIWEKAMGSPVFWQAIMTMFGMGISEVQRQKNIARADEQSDKQFERDKEMLAYKEDLYKDRYDYTHKDSGGGGKDENKKYTYNPNIKTGTFSRTG